MNYEIFVEITEFRFENLPLYNSPGASGLPAFRICMDLINESDVKFLMYVGLRQTQISPVQW